MQPLSEQTARRARGHLGQLKRLVQSYPNIVREVANLERLIAEQADPGTLEAATDSHSAAIRDPRHFKDRGPHLSPEGRIFLYDLFDSGLSVRAAAARIGIWNSSAQRHRAQWLRRTKLN